MKPQVAFSLKFKHAMKYIVAVKSKKLLKDRFFDHKCRSFLKIILQSSCQILHQNVLDKMTCLYIRAIKLFYKSNYKTVNYLSTCCHLKLSKRGRERPSNWRNVLLWQRVLQNSFWTVAKQYHCREVYSKTNIRGLLITCSIVELQVEQ